VTTPEYYYSPLLGIAVNVYGGCLKLSSRYSQYVGIVEDWVDLSKEVDPEEFLSYEALITKFWSTHRNATYFAKIDGAIHIYETGGHHSRSGLLQDTNYETSWFFTTTGLINQDRLALSKLSCEGDSVGLLDFTYGDVLNHKEVRLWEFFKGCGCGLNGSLWKTQIFQPAISPKFQGKVSVFMSKKDKDRDRRTALRPGRAFKLMFPELSVVGVEALVDKFNKEYPQGNFTLHTGKEEDHFVNAYKGSQSTMQNIETTRFRKSLANSCMRHSFDHLPQHPAAAYASGDFLSVWVEDVSKRIAARCVVYINEGGKPQAGPIYGSSEYPIDMVDGYLNTLGAEQRSSSWLGARLLKIECGGGVIAPYLDLEQDLEVVGEHLVISDSSADYDASTYDGLLGSPDRFFCTSCEEVVYEDDAYNNENGETYCSCCYNEIYAFCDESGYEYFREDLDEVRVGKGRWGWEIRLVHDPLQYNYVQIDGYYYDLDLTLTTEEGDTFLLEEGGYFYCGQCDEHHNEGFGVVAIVGGEESLVFKGWAEENDYVLVDTTYELKEAV